MTYWGFTTPPDDPRDAERYMQRIVAMTAAEMLSKEDAWVERQLRMLHPGESLCVHARSSELDADGRRGWTFTWTTSAHMLPRGEVCSQLGQRTVYGPMPACRTEDCELRYGHPGECGP
jgi:hypothetical protein